MKVLILILSVAVTWRATAAELNVKQQYEQAKNSAYSKWTTDDRKTINDFLSRVVNVFAVKIANERKAKLDQVTVDSDIPPWGSLKDVSSLAYMKAVDMIPVSNQPNVYFSGNNQLLCKITVEAAYLGLKYNLKADCVQSGSQWDLFEVRGQANLKDLNVLNQGTLDSLIDISNFQISTTAK